MYTGCLGFPGREKCRLKRMIWLCALLAASVLLGGCAVRPVNDLYCLPKRSEEYNNLQSAIDGAMAGLRYSAPISGENQQAVQMADLDGNGEAEVLVYAKGNGEKPLQILIFHRSEQGYELTATVESAGSSFDQVEYVRMVGHAGVELVVGRQVSDQVLHSVSVYSFRSGRAEQLISANYSRFLTCDQDEDGLNELFVIRPGESDSEAGIAELYGFADGTVERWEEAELSGPVDRLKRIITGRLHGGAPAVFVASTVEPNGIITDVFSLVNGKFVNISASNESGTSVQTLRNYYIYADDIDEDGIVELPSLITMRPIEQEAAAEQQIIRWYALRPNGSEVDKQYTYHNFLGGWYLKLDANRASQLTVTQDQSAKDGASFTFYLWKDNVPEKVLTIYALTGSDREEMAVQGNRIVLYRTEAVVYAADVEVAAAGYGITHDSLADRFRLIHTEWKTGVE